MDDVVEEIAKDLKNLNYAIIDNFMSRKECRKVRKEVEAWKQVGNMKPGVLAGGKTGNDLAYIMEEVLTFISWFKKNLVIGSW